MREANEKKRNMNNKKEKKRRAKETSFDKQNEHLYSAHDMFVSLFYPAYVTDDEHDNGK